MSIIVGDARAQTVLSAPRRLGIIRFIKLLHRVVEAMGTDAANIKRINLSQQSMISRRLTDK